MRRARGSSRPTASELLPATDTSIRSRRRNAEIVGKSVVAGRRQGSTQRQRTRLESIRRSRREDVNQRAPPGISRRQVDALYLCSAVCSHARNRRKTLLRKRRSCHHAPATSRPRAMCRRAALEHQIVNNLCGVTHMAIQHDDCRFERTAPTERRLSMAHEKRQYAAANRAAGLFEDRTCRSITKIRMWRHKSHARKRVRGVEPSSCLSDQLIRHRN